MKIFKWGEIKVGELGLLQIGKKKFEAIIDGDEKVVRVVQSGEPLR